MALLSCFYKLRQHFVFSLEPVVKRIFHSATFRKSETVRPLLNFPLHPEVFFKTKFILRPNRRLRQAGIRRRLLAVGCRVKLNVWTRFIARTSGDFGLRFHGRTSTTELSEP